MDRLHLIAEIFSRPALWDLQSEEYKTRANVPAMWKEVASNMGPNVKVDECKRKWKNLRDAYRAEIKRIELRIERDILHGRYDQKNDYGSKWAYFEHLKFIKDIKRPRRRKINEYLNSCSNDNYNDDNDFADFHNIDNKNFQNDIENNTDSLSLNSDDYAKDSRIYSENLRKEAENQQTDIENNGETNPPIKFNTLTQHTGKDKLDINDDQTAKRCKCCKRSYDQVDTTDDLNIANEQTLMKRLRLDTARSNDLTHIGDSDYNFLMSFLPQIKKMNELQNMKFRAKMSYFILNIMSETAAPIPPL